MKALRVLLIIAAVLVAAILIVPLFAPSTVVVTATEEIALEAEQVFPVVASFKGREKWDPWVTQDSTTKVDIISKPAYVGSSYTWNGEKLGIGRMEVISVRENEYIESHLWFGDVDDWSLVEWSFEPTESGVLVSWSFTEDTKYPLERLGMMFGAKFLKMSFDAGLSSLKELMEAGPVRKSVTGEISFETQPAFDALVMDASGTMKEIGTKLGDIYGGVFSTVGLQGLEIIGPAFVYYLDHDEETGFSNFQAGVPVGAGAKDAGNVKLVSFPEMEVLMVEHKGPYEEFIHSYNAVEKYMETQDVALQGTAFESYVVTAQQTQDQSEWMTLITFPLK